MITRSSSTIGSGGGPCGLPGSGTSSYMSLGIMSSHITDKLCNTLHISTMAIKFSTSYLRSKRIIDDLFCFCFRCFLKQSFSYVMVCLSVHPLGLALIINLDMLKRFQSLQDDISNIYVRFGKHRNFIIITRKSVRPFKTFISTFF